MQHFIMVGKSIFIHQILLGGYDSSFINKATELLTIFPDFDHFARCLDALEQGNYDSRR